MRTLVIAGLALVWPVAAQASDWQKFYHPYPDPKGMLIAHAGTPEQIATSGNFEADIERMWRNGYGPVGYTAFNSPNANTDDGFKLAKKLKARFMIVGTAQVSSTTTTVPITTPNVQTSYTLGSANAYGTGGSAYGSYSGTTTTYGSKTNYVPITLNRFDKAAVYFQEMRKVGSGILIRELTSEEVARFETQRAIAVRAVRDGGPAYNANILPGDVILKVNDQPADNANWQAAIAGNAPLQVELVRNGSPRSVSMVIPPEWKPN